VNVELTEATAADAPAIAKLHCAVADRLTEEFGRGHWSSHVSEKGVLFALKTSHVFVARDEMKVVGSLRLSTTKPWAIDRSYFTKCERPLYLTAMAVEPAEQRRGIGRAMLDEAKQIGRAWPADAIRLDAYDTAAGAGEFYARCGFREVGRVTYRATPLIYYELLFS
jgi:ribosomal protein S18 acetylase RimI-like enzyme